MVETSDEGAILRGRCADSRGDFAAALALLVRRPPALDRADVGAFDGHPGGFRRRGGAP